MATYNDPYIKVKEIPSVCAGMIVTLKRKNDNYEIHSFVLCVAEDSKSFQGLYLVNFLGYENSTFLTEDIIETAQMFPSGKVNLFRKE